jgi:L-fuconolactonase
MSRLADDTSGVCKFSGLVTEAGDGWTIDDIRPFADHVLKAFGPDRVMWGSDWPVCRLKADYGTWYDMARRLTSHLPETSRDQIFAGTVRRFYRLV